MWPSDASFQSIGSLPSTYPTLSSPHQLIPSHSSLPRPLSFFLRVPQERSRRPAQTPLRVRGAATMPGAALGPGGCDARGRPGLSRAPARTPHYSNMPPTGLLGAEDIRSICGRRQSGPGPGGAGGRGVLEATEYTEGVFWVGFDVALVGAGYLRPGCRPFAHVAGGGGQ